ncbi:MAG TPA: hypothetical protein VF198_05375 [Vicinamibacterales bacterium]
MPGASDRDVPWDTPITASYRRDSAVDTSGRKARRWSAICISNISSTSPDSTYDGAMP